MPRVVILLIILGIYLLLGTFLEGFSMLVLTLPIVIPIVTALGYDLIWFGVVMVICFFCAGFSASFAAAVPSARVSSAVLLAS